MMLVAGILNSLGGLLILFGAFRQSRQEERDWTRGRQMRIEEREGPSHLFNVFAVDFASEYGWRLILAGGALVFLGSLVATISAATGRP